MSEELSRSLGGRQSLPPSYDEVACEAAVRPAAQAVKEDSSLFLHGGDDSDRRLEHSLCVLPSPPPDCCRAELTVEAVVQAGDKLVKTSSIAH